MNAIELSSYLQSQAASLKEKGVTSLFLFGSRARGDNRPDSDIDMFIDYNAARKVPSYFELLEFSKRVEERFGLPVHLGTRASLDPLIRDKVENMAVKVF